MRRMSFGVLLIALSTLVLELMLTRVFDITLTPNLSYFVVSLAVFSFGLAGIYATLKPIAPDTEIRGRLVGCTVGFAASVLLLHPIINFLPLNYLAVAQHPIRTVLSFGALYITLLVPFFLAGYVLIAIFSKYSAKIQRLYFWDLVGAGVGTIICIPFVSLMGPGGLIVCAAALGLLSAALFTESRAATRGYIVAAVVVAAVPIIRGQHYIDYKYNMDKRGIMTAIAQGRLELTRWDPIAKIDVLDETWTPQISVPWHKSGDRKAIEYDGGNQTSYFYKFDGNLKALREQMDRDRSKVNEHFWQIGVLASHYLKRDTDHSVLVIGSAGGQETKASLIYGAKYIDTAELVPTVVGLATGQYSPYIGDIFHNPAVHYHVAEGRSFLRSTDRKYDIIQIYSNHTSSSITQGSGAMSPIYLQTEEAYEEYFSHLTPDGVVHINHYGYPRMISTAALAWKKMGRTDFRKHVLLFFSPSELTLPTLLIKMTPWTAEEVASLSAYLAPPELDEKDRLVVMENPLDPSKSFLSDDFYSGNFPAELAERMPVDFKPVTDDNPYFSVFRKHYGQLRSDPKTFVDPGTAYMLNASMLHGVPMDQIHLWITAGASLVFALLFIILPLRFSKVGREEGSTALPLLAYFSCLGAGFITLELVFIQKFMEVIGSPLLTYSTVLFAMLIGAGIGSAASERLGINSQRRWALPFIAVIVIGLGLVLLYPVVSKAALQLPIEGRMAVSALMIFPLGFFLGMPFPLGILAIEKQPRGAVAWAWGMNGLFTVAGGLASVISGLEFGFNMTIVFALVLYAFALAVYRRMRDTVVHSETSKSRIDASWQAGAAARSTQSQV
jgi:spermidine synthase